jgi:peptidoglycan/LPS O-acetylase OafA/YrhL
VTRPAAPSALPSTHAGALPVVDLLRGISILWVTLFHFYVDTRGVPGLEVGARACLSSLRSGDVACAVGCAANALVARPAFRIDLFLFVTGLVLMLRPAAPASAFVARRMRSVLPSYWLSSLLALAVIVILAGLRAAVTGGSFAVELHQGSLLAGEPYRLEVLDLVRSLSLVGRFQSPRTMQVIAPSMWYVVLVLQAYCVFPALRAFLSRAGPIQFFLAIVALTWLGRWLVFRHAPFASFDPNATVLYFIPFRLAPLAAGMVASRWAAGLRAVPTRGQALALVGPSLALVLAAVWASSEVNTPGTALGAIGPVATLLPALPGFWMASAAAGTVPGLRRVLTWAGRHSISILAVQDPLRFMVGTAVTLHGTLTLWTWWLTPAYLAASLFFAWVWAPWPAWVGARLWGQSSRPALPRKGPS